MKRYLCIMLAVSCIVLLGAGCEKKEPQKATLSLASNPTTGYEWVVEQDPELFDVESNYVEGENSEGLVGVGGTQTFVLSPKEAGKATVNFYYKRSWEEAYDTRLTYVMKVDKNMQITNEAFTSEIGSTADKLPELPQIVIK